MLVAFFSLLLISLINSAPVLEDGNLKSNGYVGEYGEFFEGDMILTIQQQRAIEEAKATRNGVANIYARWPGATVVYYITENVFDQFQVEMIKRAMADISSKSCIKFRPRNGNEHAVTIQSLPLRGCSANVGFLPGQEQTLNLEPGCFDHGTIVHEMLHTIGFQHMQSTYDRDNFVKINWENIQRGMEYNFEKYTQDTVTDFGVPYDYGSLMHYEETAFTVNGLKTIVALQPGVTLGQRQGLSERDILKLNKMYCM